jgi:hypothetical protein
MGVRSYQDFARGLALLLFAAAVVRTVGLSRPLGYLMGLPSLTYLVQGWVIGAEGFSGTHSTLIDPGRLRLQPCLDDLAGRRRVADADLEGPSPGRMAWAHSAEQGPSEHGPECTLVTLGPLVGKVDCGRRRGTDR